MSSHRDIRELAQRAELEFHVRPHRFRSRAWCSGIILAMACCGWLAYAAIVGDHRVYEAGPLSASHAFIANDCRQCHTSWQPAQRLAGGGSGVSSIDNASCLKCHAAAAHHVNQVPAHAELSCAECHREHQGQQTLADVTDRHCVRCHGDLHTTAGPSNQFARSIRGFNEADGHPEFNLLERLKSPNTKSNLLTAGDLEKILRDSPVPGPLPQPLMDVLVRTEEPTDPARPSVRDRGEVKFNHAAHLDPQRIKDKNGRHVDLSHNCQACHMADAAGQYMLPIRYAQHCAQCHPLLFDNLNYPGEAVPHADPQVVRGFLTEKYTLTVLKRESPFTAAPVVRPMPGRTDRSPLQADQAQRLNELVAQAELVTQDHTRIVKSRGGCKLCHTVNDSPGNVSWTIKPTSIPDRWLPHSRFGHSAHRMLRCVECHVDVEKKKDSADVMLSGIQACRECHVSANAAPRTTVSVTSRDNLVFATAHDVTSKCVLCHVYHQRDTDRSGGLDPHLQSGPQPQP